MAPAKWIATCFGIGYIQKGAGTIAALFYCLVWYGCKVATLSLPVQLFILLLLFFIGVWAANIVEKEWGQDSNRVVVDEVFGMGAALIFVPSTWLCLLITFILFRAFDIAKPLYIRRLEKLPSGWGVMADDLLAGIYTNAILQLLLYLHVFSTP